MTNILFNVNKELKRNIINHLSIAYNEVNIYSQIDIAFIEDHLQLVKEVKKNNKDCLIVLISYDYSLYKEIFDLKIFQYMIYPLDKSYLKLELKRLVDEYHQLNKKMIIPCLHQKMILYTDDILCVETYYKKIMIHTINDIYEVHIHQKDKILSNIQHFIKLNQSTYINQKAIIFNGHDYYLLRNQKRYYK